MTFLTYLLNKENRNGKNYCNIFLRFCGIGSFPDSVGMSPELLRQNVVGRRARIGWHLWARYLKKQGSVLN